MGPKKKAAEDGEDLSCEKFFIKYKKNCQAIEQPICKLIKEAYEKEYLDEGSNLTKFHIWEPIGWQGVKALMEALKAVNYQHTKSIRLWKSQCEDEGVRAVCNYIQTCDSVLVLELLNNMITPLGCQFIGNLLHPQSKTNLLQVRIDHNDFGSEGLKFLTEGLSQNKNVQILSLTYCNIDEKGARSLFEILIYQQSALEDIDLSGNHLRNDGVIEVLRGASIAKNLKKLWLADNQFIEENDVLDAFDMCMKKNQNLGQYNIKFNFISDYGILKLCETLEAANHVYVLEIPERISKETLETYKEKLANNKPKKGKKGGKGKKKKK